MKNNIMVLIIIVLVMATVAACRANNPPPQQEPNETSEETQQEDQPNQVEWPETKEDEIMVEGIKETIELKIFEARENNYVTYVPEDFVVETVSSGEGDGYWFYSNLQGNKRDDVYLQLFFFPETVTTPPTLIGEKGFLTVGGREFERIEAGAKYHDWSLEEYRSIDQDTLVFLGKHQEKYFLATESYPQEFAEGIGPRINKIIENLYWLDTGEYLVEREDN